MRKFLLGVVIMVLAVVTMLVLPLFGVSREISLSSSFIVACIGFGLQISALLDERAKTQEIEMRFHNLMKKRD